jgi:hypothetical protein
MNLPFFWTPGTRSVPLPELDESFERECTDAFAVAPQPKPTPVQRLQDGMDGIINTLRDRDADYDDEIEELEKRLAETREDKATNLAQLARIERAYDTLTETEKPVSRPSKSKKTEVAAG